MGSDAVRDGDLFTPPAPPQVLLRNAGSAIAHRWWWVPIGMIIGVLIMVGVMRLSDPVYEASMLVAPVSDNTGGLAGKIGQLSGLASLAGVKLPDSETATPFSQFLEMLTAREVVQRVDRQLNLRKLLFPKNWDPGTRRLVAGDGFVTDTKSLLANVAGTPAHLVPDLDDVTLRLADKITITALPKSGIRRITLKFKTPEDAVAVLAALHRTADKIVRDRTQIRVQQQIDRLLQALPSVVYPEQRQGIASLLMAQEQQAMVASTGDTFAAAIVSDPVAPSQPVFPRPAIMLAIGAVLGALAAIAGAVVRAGSSKSHRMPIDD